MKKLIITTSIILGLAMTTFADPNGGGLFKRGDEPEKGGVNGTRGGGFPVIPGHGGTSNADAPPSAPASPC